MKPLYILFSLLIVLYLIFTKDIKSNNFIFIHDEFLAITKNETLGFFSTLRTSDFGTSNTVLMLVTFLSRVVYYVLFWLGLSLENVQKVMYIIKLSIALFLPYIGFLRLKNLFLKDNTTNWAILLTTLFYAFNPYTLIYWNGMSFSLTLLVMYSLAPLAFYLINQVFFDNPRKSDYIKLSILIFLMSFAFYLFIVFLLIAVLYIIIYSIVKKRVILTLKRTLIIGIYTLPILSVHFSLFYDTFFGHVVTRNLEGGETYENLKGGLMYPLLMWFSWGFYTYWSPRNFFTFTDYLKSVPSIIAPFFYYYLFYLALAKKKVDKRILVLGLAFLICIFFAKGAQEPFGVFYLDLIQKVSFFRIFRSPDNKFGFGAIFSLSVIVLYVLLLDTRKILKYIILSAILIQSIPFLTSEAIVGKNSDKSSDRIISVSPEAQELADYINAQSDDGSSVISFPPVDFGSFYTKDKDIHIGQDLLPKIITKPIIYKTSYSGMYIGAYQKLSLLLEQMSIAEFNEFPIKYFLFRTDTFNDLYDVSFEQEVSKYFELVFENNYYKLYLNPLHVNLIESDQEINYDLLNPHKIRVDFPMPSSTSIEFTLNRSFNPNYIIFANREYKSNITLFDFLNKDSKIDYIHEINNLYGNRWKLVNNDTIPFSVTIYLKTQIVFIVASFISSSILIVYLLYILYDVKRNKKL